MNEPAFEQEVRKRGEELLKKADSIRRRGFLITRRYWEEKIFDFVMKRESLKVQLLRFIDTYPALSGKGQRFNHLMQYLDACKESKDLLTRLFIFLLSIHPFPLKTIYSLGTNIGVSFFARKFIAGTSPREAFKYIRRLHRKKMTCTLDILGEAVLSEQEAEEYTQEYIDLIESVSRIIRESRLDVPMNVSVKPSSFYSQFNPSAPEHTCDKVCERLYKILRKAKEHNAFVMLDTEQYDYRDMSFTIFEKIATEDEFKDYAHLGMVVQAYLQDSPEFTSRVIDLARRRGTPFKVRLVKGAYWDYEIIHARQLEWDIPVYLRKWHTDARFEHLSRMLLDAYPALKLAIGSHNIRSISHAMAYAGSKELAREEVEFQILFGMGDDIKDAISAMGYPVKVYAPYGELIPGMAYLVRRILENTSNESFLRQRSTNPRMAGALLRNPLDFARNDNERNHFITVS